MLLEGVRMAAVQNGGRQSQQQPHSRKGGGGTIFHHEKCSVGERLYYHGHVCNHARCAANNPDYNVKTSVPPKKFLVSKKQAYGGVEETGGEKTRTKSGNSSTTTSSDHRCDRNHALQSLTNSLLSTETGKARSNRSNGVLATANIKARSNGMQHSRLTRATTSSGSKKVVAERRGRPISQSSNTAHSQSTSGLSSVTRESRQSETHTSRLSNAIRSPPSQATEQSSKQWEGSSSPESSITSIKITQKIVSTRVGDEENGEHHVAEGATAASSPTASVGSNHDTEISSLKETNITVVEQCEIVEQSTANLGDLLYFPADSESSSPNTNLHKENTCEFPSPSVDSKLLSVSEPLSSSTQSTSFAPRTPEISSPTTTPVSEISSSTLRKSSEGEEVNYESTTPSVASSRPASSPPLTSSVTSVKSGARRSSTSNGRSSLTTPPPSSSATKLARKFVNNLKESSRVGSPRLSSSSPGSSANRPSRPPRSCETQPKADSSPAPTNVSRLSKTFIMDLQPRTVVRKPSTKGVRSIELRGGKAQSYSTTTVTSWNVTTTTVETTLSVSGTLEETVDSGLSASGPGEEVAIRMPEQSSRKESQSANAGSIGSTLDSKPSNEAPAMMKCVKNVKTVEEKRSESETVSLKFVKNAKSLEEVHAERETVYLKHGEVAERRLSEEYLTNHALEKKISDKDHRVKVLVHAFETLRTPADDEVPGGEGGTLNGQLGHASSSAITVTV